MVFARPNPVTPPTWRCLLPLVLVLTAPTLVYAQAWQRVIESNGAAGSAIGGGQADTLYAGMASGPVFRSTDNGLTWTGVTNGLVDNASRILVAKAFVVTPTGRILRGGDNASWNNRVGSPLFFSDNQGASWTEVPLPFGVVPRNPSGIGISDLVLHQGALYFSDLLSEGVWKSTDDGLTWNVAGAQLPTAPFVSNTKVYYAVASTGNALLTIQASKGVFRSTDGGATWNQAVNGIPGVVDSPVVGGRTWNGSDVVGLPDGTAFAVSDGRLYRTRDAGLTWREVGAGILQSPNPFVPSVFQPSARKVEVLGDRVFVSTTDTNPRFFEGTALGDSWTELPRVNGNASNASQLAQSFYAHNEALYFAGDTAIHRLGLASAVRTNLPPVATVIPSGPFYANVGGRVAATAKAQGTAPFTFEWQVNGVPIPGQTASVLDFSPSNTNQSGAIAVVVANAAGRVTNAFGRLIVAPSGPGHPDLSFQPQSPGNVTVLAIDQDGSVFHGGPFNSQLDAYTGVRKSSVDGRPDPTFVTGAVIGSGSGPGLTTGTPRALLPLGDGSILVGAADVSINARYYRRLLPNGAIDANWPWPQETAGGPRKFAKLPDGRFLIAGGSTGGIHRLHADGSFDASFLGPVNIGSIQSEYVTDFAVLPDGAVIFVGKFNEVDGEPRVGIARLLPSGALDRTWIPAQPPLSSTVLTLAVQSDGRILIGGSFSTFGSQTYRGLARLLPDGKLDASFGTVLPNGSTVTALARQPDDKVWVGGRFSGVQGRNHLVRLNSDGSLDTAAPNPGLPSTSSSQVQLLRFTDDGRLWIGSASLPIAGQTNVNLARFFTDLTGPSLGYAGLDQSPDAGTSIALRGAVSGTFTALQWRFQGSPLPGATSLEWPLPNLTAANSGLYDLVVTSAGGSHTSAPVRVRVRGPVVIDQAPISVVAAVSNSATLSVTAFGQTPLSFQWFKDGVAVPNATGRSLSLTNLPFSASGDYSVRVTGSDGSAAEGGPAFLSVVAAPGSTNEAFRPALSTTTTFTTFRDITFLPDGQAVVGGNFSVTGPGGPNAFLARLNIDGSVDPTFRFNPSGVSDFGAVERQPDGRYVILIRLSAASAPWVIRRLLADGSPDASFTETTVFFGNDLRLHPDGGILVLGNRGLERRNSDGSVDTAFNLRAPMNGEAHSADVDPSGRIYVAGYFSTVAGISRPGLARLLSDGTLDSTFVPTQTFSSTRTVTALPDAVLAGDSDRFFRLTSSGAVDATYGWSTRLAKWDLTPTGRLIGLLVDTQGNGVIRTAEGLPDRPFASLRVPTSQISYSWIRVSPDGSIWLAKGSNGSLDPATLLFRLNGVVTPLAILAQPKSQTVLPGAEARFQVTASGTSSLRFQWQLNGQDLAGETNSVLVIQDAQASRTGNYTVRITNRSGSLTSQPATLALLVAPVISAQPASLILSPGETARLEVTASGFLQQFQWIAGGTNLPGATNPVLILSNVQPANAGSYFVRISNPAGSLDSRPAKLRIRPVPATGVGTGPSSGLVRRWRFENNLTESIGGLTTIPFGLFTYPPGIESDTSLKLRSGQNWVQLGDGPGAGGRLTDELFTLAFWIKPESEGTLNPLSYILLSRGLNLGTFVGKELTLWLGGSDNILGAHRLKLGANGLNSVVSTDPRAYVPNLVGKWTHFAITYRGEAANNPANFSIHINGEKLVLGGGPVDFTPNNLQNAFGRYSPVANFQLDDFRVYNRPLSDAEVASLIQPPTPVQPPAITSQPSGGTVAAGSGFTFNVGATGPDLFFEWFRGTNSLPDFDGSSLSLASVSALDAGDYRVVISNGGGSTNSTLASLTVNSADPFTLWAAANGLSGQSALRGADADADGSNNLAEFAYGTSPSNSLQRPLFTVSTTIVNGQDFPTVTFTRRLNIGSTRIRVLASQSLDFSASLQAIEVGAAPSGDIETVTVRSPLPSDPNQQQFFQLTVEP